MRNSRSLWRSLGIFTASLGLGALLFPAPLGAQRVARDALALFPADTHQVVYSSLVQLRALPDYPQIRRRILHRQMRDFQEFLIRIGTNPEKDVDEIMMGWRGPVEETLASFGLAGGRFQPERVREFYVRHKLHFRQYAGLDLFAYGSGEDRSDLYFTFLDSSRAAFGRFNDLKALLDVRERSLPALDSNSKFNEWEAEVEGTAPQWGIVTGKAAANQAAGWLTAGTKLKSDPSALLAPVQAVLYRLEWGGGMTTRVSILCENPSTASALGQLFTLLRDSTRSSGLRPAPSIVPFVETLEMDVSGSRLELRASAPIAAVDEFVHGP